VSELDEVVPVTGFTIITGLSGAGRSEAARCLEDLGYFVVDNLPPALLPKMAELTTRPGGPARVAIVVDARGGVFFSELSKALEELKKLHADYRIVFLEASDDDLVIDTSGLTPHELRDRIRESFADAPPEEGIQVSVVSFGFKFGAPRDADMQLDVRFLPNPHWVPELRALPGTDRRVKEFVEAQDAYGTFIERVTALLDATVPGFIAEGKSYLTVSIGCTGGHHRSVVVAEALGAYFRDHGLPVVVVHRDVDRG